MPVDVIAIDGPAASGKSTIAKRLSERLGIPYVNTGAMYRAIAWKAMKSGVDMGNPMALEALLPSLSMRYHPGAPCGRELEINGEFPGGELRSPEVSEQACKVAALPQVRAWLVGRQRTMAGEGMIVMEGRDIGTDVFPDARHKFFLTASPRVRAMRRLAQGGETPDGATVDSVAREIAARDEMDMKRAVAPLRKAADAILIDSSDMTVEQVLEMIIGAMDGK